MKCYNSLFVCLTVILLFCQTFICACPDGFTGFDCSIVDAQLESNKPITAKLSISKWAYYHVQVPSRLDMLTFFLNDTDGNCDIYIMNGTYPTIETFVASDISLDDISYISISNPSQQIWYASVYGVETCSYSIGVHFGPEMAFVQLNAIAHVQDIGDVSKSGSKGLYLGTTGQNRRLEGFQLQFATLIPGLQLEYMAHLANFGDTRWTAAGSFCGTRGQRRQVEGVAFRLSGQVASHYKLKYRANLAGTGLTAYSTENGQFIGTRGQSRRLEGFEISIERIQLPYQIIEFGA